MIATVVLKSLWLTPIADLATGGGMPFRVNSISYTPTLSVTFTLFANGQWQPVRQPGKQQIAKVGLLGLSDVQVQFLEDQQGKLLCYRDPRGRRIFGTYIDLTPAPGQRENYWSAAFTFNETAFTEPV